MQHGADGSPERPPTSAAGYALVLMVLTIAFAARVLVQVVQWIARRAGDEVGWLPAFDDWQSGALPYGMLLAAQVVIIEIMLRITRRVRAGRAVLRSPWFELVGLFGVMYFAFMAVRLMVGLTVADEGSWFDNPLPSVFHLVLATFLLTWVGWSRHKRAPV